MNIILLSGGSGTRLWPLSNEIRSKQFLKILRTEDGKHESMVQRMYRMIKKVSPDARVVIATSETQVASIKRQLHEDVEISVEPCRRDTFPAIALSVAYLHDVVGINENESVVVCPVDPLVDENYFKTLKVMFDVAGQKNLTLMGIKPTYPSEKYGYIIFKNNSVDFKEKPELKDAEEYIRHGALWNGGVFAFKINYLLNKANKLFGVYKYAELLNEYSELKKISFDYAVAENEKDIEVIEYNGEWKDLGTWNTLTEAMEDAIGGNGIIGENCENVHIINELTVPIIALGLKSVVIAASPDGILVSDKHSSSYLKKYVPTQQPMFEEKEWGDCKVLNINDFNDGSRVVTREITILSGRKVSFNSDLDSQKSLCFVKGFGTLIVGEESCCLSPGAVMNIRANQSFLIECNERLHIIEVQISENFIK